MRTLQTQQEETKSTLCPRCGGDASWQAAEEQITILCGDCGHYEITRAELERLEQDAVWPEPDERT